MITHSPFIPTILEDGIYMLLLLKFNESGLLVDSAMRTITVINYSDSDQLLGILDLGNTLGWYVTGLVKVKDNS